MRLLLTLLLSFSVLANYPVIDAGSGVREYKTGVPYREDEIVWEQFDFYRVLSDFTATDLATDRGNSLLEKMVDPNDYLVGLTGNVQNQLDALDGRVTVNEGDIANNQANIATNASAIATNASDISTNQTNIASNLNGINNNATNIASNDVDIADLDTRTTQNRTDIDSNDTDIATNQVNISTNVLNISSNDTDIAALQTQQGLNTTQIATNVTDIASNDTDILALQTQQGLNTTQIATNVTGIAANLAEIAANDLELADYLSRILVLETNTTDAVNGTIDTNSISAELITASVLLTTTGKMNLSGANEASILGPTFNQTDIDAILTPLEGDTVYNLEENQYNYYDGTDWRPLGGSSSGGAYFVGAVAYATGGSCVWSKPAAGFGPFPVNAACTPTIVSGNSELAAPDTSLPAIKITNARTDGYYNVKFQGLLWSGGVGQCNFSLSDTNAYAGGGIGHSGASGSESSSNSLDQNFRFNTSGDKQIQILSGKVSGTAPCQVYGDGVNYPSEFSVYFYPDSAKSIETAEYTRGHARYYKSSSSTVGGVDVTTIFDTLYPNTPDTLGKYNPATGLFTETESGKCYQISAGVNATPSSNNEYFYYMNSSVNGQFVANRITGAGLVSNAVRGSIPSGRYCTVLGEVLDIRFRSGVITGGLLTFIDILESPSSGVIAGDFEEIDSTGIYRAEVNQTVSYTYPNGATTVNIPTVTWTAPKTANYLISGGYLLNNADQGVFIAKLNISDSNHRDQSFYTKNNGNFLSVRMPPKVFNVTEGTVVTLQMEKNSGSSTLSAGHLSIYEQPDTATLVRNIIGDQTTECQTKFLQADIFSATTIIPLSFNNLDTSKNYSVTMQSSWAYSTLNTCEIYMNDGSQIVARTVNREADANSDRTVQSDGNPFFKPSTSTLTTFFFENSNCTLEGNGTYSETWVTLCELPATTISTNKFD